MRFLRALGRHYSTLPDPGITLQKFKFARASHAVGALKDGDSATLQGWVAKKPKKMGKGLVFGKLRGPNGQTVQLVDRHEPSLIKSLQPESAIAVDGVMEGETDLVVSSVQVLNKSNIVGSQLTTGNTKDWPAEHRYLQLRASQGLQQNLKQRAQIIHTCRDALNELEFTEIETPLLFKSTPEGAREFLVPTRKKNFMYALPQSPQQYKQLLMASGVHKYYQIAKCFRDEDLRQDRQYEFTQLDMEMSFAGGADVRRVIEHVVRKIWTSVGKRLYLSNGDGVHHGSGFKMLTYRDAIAKYGIDKPDLRYEHEIVDISDLAVSTNEDFPVVEAMVVKNVDNNDVSALWDPTQYKRMPFIVTGENWTQECRLANLKDIDTIKARLQVEPGDVVAIGNRQSMSYENPTPLGRFRQVAIDQFPEKGLMCNSQGETIKPREDFVACWVVDFPLFTPAELTQEGDEYPSYDSSQYVTTHHPFTMCHLEDYALLETAPLQVRGQHYDLVINGVEVGGGSTRIHDVNLQTYIFDQVLRINNYDQLFGHLLRAFATGCPPHAGLAIGLDRMTAMLCGTPSIRDVIAFPKTITGADPMIGCPSKVSRSQLEPYHIRAS